MGKRELVGLLSLSSWCLVIVVWLSLALSWIFLQFLIVAFSDHTHLLFLAKQILWLLLAVFMWCKTIVLGLKLAIEF